MTVITNSDRLVIRDWIEAGKNLVVPAGRWRSSRKPTVQWSAA
jgi:hypothetical protein